MSSASHIAGRDQHFIRQAGVRFVALFVAFVFAISLPVVGTGSALAEMGLGISSHPGTTPWTLPDASEALPFAESVRELDRSRFHTFPVILSSAVQLVAHSNDGTQPECIAPGGFNLNPAVRLPFSRGPPARS